MADIHGSVRRPVRGGARCAGAEPGLGRGTGRVARPGHRRGHRHRHVGRLPRPGPHGPVVAGHHHQRLVHDQDGDQPGRADAGRPGRAGRRRPGREVLARVRRERQAGRPGPPRHVARLRGFRARPARRRGGPVRLGPVHLPVGGPGAVVGAGHRVGLPRAELRPPGRRDRAADQRQVAQAVRGRGDRRSAGRRFPDRRRGKRLGPDRGRGPAAAAAVRLGGARTRTAWRSRR